MKKHFLNSAFGSYLKVFITVILTNYLAMGVSIFELDLNSIKILVSSAVASVIPIVINALNPNDPRYGKKDTKTDI
jgi:hypothetical protein